MKETIEITKRETLEDDNTFIVKVPYEVGDEFGNKATLYRREVIRKEDLESQRAELLKQVEVIDEKLEGIDSIEEKK